MTLENLGLGSGELQRDWVTLGLALALEAWSLESKGLDGMDNDEVDELGEEGAAYIDDGWVMTEIERLSREVLIASRYPSTHLC